MSRPPPSEIRAPNPLLLGGSSPCVRLSHRRWGWDTPGAVCPAVSRCGRFDSLSRHSGFPAIRGALHRGELVAGIRAGVIKTPRPDSQRPAMLVAQGFFGFFLSQILGVKLLPKLGEKGQISKRLRNATTFAESLHLASRKLPEREFSRNNCIKSVQKVQSGWNHILGPTSLF